MSSRFLCLLPALALVLAGNAQAATSTWTGSPSTSDWFTAADWGGTAVASGNSLTFTSTNASSTTTLNDDLTAGFSIGGIIFNSGALAYTMTGNSFALGGGIANNGTNTETINNAITLAAVQTFTTNTSGGLTLGGTISGAGGMTKAGAGTLTLGGTNTYTGATTISAGTLQIGNGSSTGSISASSSISNSGALVFDSTTSSTYGGVISGSGTLTQEGTGKSTLSGANTYIGGTTVSAGTLEFGQTDAMSATGTVSVNSGGTLAISVGGSGQFTNGTSGNGTIGGTFAGLGGQAGGTVTLATGSAVGIDTSSGSVSYAGNITNAGVGLTKLGSNTLTLTGTNTYSGATTISAGTLQIGNGSNTGSISNSSSISNSGALIFDSTTNSTFGGVISGTGSLTQEAASTVTLSGANTYGGTTKLVAGIVQADNSAALGTGTISFTGGTLQYGPGITQDFSSRFSTATSQSYAIDTNGNNIAFATPLNSITGSLALSDSAGTGSLTLNAMGNFTYTGTSTISSGATLINGVTNALPTPTTLTDNGTYNLNGFSQEVASVSGSGVITNSSATPTTLTVYSTVNSTFAGTLTGNISLLLTGNAGGLLTLAGTGSTYSGNATITNDSELSVGNLSSLGTNSTLNISSGTLQYTGSGATLSKNIVLAGAGAGYAPSNYLQNTGGGVETLNGSITLNSSTLYFYSGNFVVNGTITGSNPSSSEFALYLDGGAVVGLTAANSYTGVTGVGSGSTILTGVDNALPNSSVLYLGTDGYEPYTLDILGHSEVVSSIGSGQVLSGNGNAGTDTLSTGPSSATGSLTVNMNYGTESSVGLVLASLGGSNGYNNFSLTVTGTGTLSLAGSNTYTGGTTVNGGTLLANSPNATGTGAVIVNSGGALGGAGTINTSGVSSGNAVTFASGSLLNQIAANSGNGIGITSKLTLALQAGTTVNLQSGAQFAFDLGASGVNDQVAVTGGSLTLNIQSLSSFTFATQSPFNGTGTYTLFTTDGLNSGHDDITGTLGATPGILGTVSGTFVIGANTYSGTLSVLNADNLRLVVASVPEPSTWVLMIGGLALLLGCQIRRRQVRQPHGILAK